MLSFLMMEYLDLKRKKGFFDDNPQNLKQSRSNYVMPVSKKWKVLKDLLDH